VGYTVVTDAASEPVSLTEVRLQLNRDSSFTAHDDLLNIYIKAARQLVEQKSNTVLIEKTIDEVFQDFPAQSGTSDEAMLRLSLYPPSSVTSITYKDSDGNSATVNSSNYIVDTTRGFPRIATANNFIWPLTYDEINAVTVRYVAGYSSTTGIPAYLRTAVLLTVAEWYWNRENYVKRFSTAVDNLIATERVFEF